MGKFLVSLTTATFLLVTTIAASAQTAAPEQMLAAVNTARAAEGLAGLTLDLRLNAAACRQARDLAGKALNQLDALTHQGSDGSDLAGRLHDAGYGFRTAAEKLAAGVADPRETTRLWLASEDHRRNMLNPAFREAGAAFLGARVSPGGNRQGPMDVWVLVLAAPLGPGTDGPSTAAEAKNPKDCPG